MFPGHYCEIFGLGERLGCILNLSHSFDAIGVSLELLVCSYASLLCTILLHSLALLRQYGRGFGIGGRPG